VGERRDDALRKRYGRDELQAALGNPPLTAGSRLTGLPATLNDTTSGTTFSLHTSALLTTDTVTTVTTVAEFTADVTVAPRTVLAAEADSLVGTPPVISYTLSSDTFRALDSNPAGQGTADHVFTYYDGNGRKLFTNENGGVWTRYFYDGAGNVTKKCDSSRWTR